MVFDLGTRLLLHFASLFALGSPILDLLIRPLRRSISEIMDLQLTNQIAVYSKSVRDLVQWSLRCLRDPQALSSTLASLRMLQPRAFGSLKMRRDLGLSL